MENTTTDYEGKFKKIAFIMGDLHERYDKILERNNNNASGYLSVYKMIIKNNIHKDFIKIKNWIDNRYFSKDNTPLGTYIDNQMNQLEEMLENGDDDAIKQTTLKTILSEICDSLPNIEKKLGYAK